MAKKIVIICLVLLALLFIANVAVGGIRFDNTPQNSETVTADNSRVLNALQQEIQAQMSDIHVAVTYTEYATLQTVAGSSFSTVLSGHITASGTISASTISAVGKFLCERSSLYEIAPDMVEVVAEHKVFILTKSDGGMATCDEWISDQMYQSLEKQAK